MNRADAIKIFKAEVERVATLAILGKYCSDATYGADHTIGKWLQLKMPEYVRNKAIEMGANEALIEEIWSQHESIS